MKFEKFESEDIRSMYDLMEKAFPPEERRIYENHKILYDKGYFDVFGKKDQQGNVIALISIWKLDKIRYIEHLAIKKELRRKGIGGELLQFVFQHENAPFVLEVELPDNETAIKRIQFYEKQGMEKKEIIKYVEEFKRQREEHGMLPLRLMTYPQKIDEKTYQIYKNMLHERVYFYFKK